MVEALKDEDFREKAWLLFRRPNLKNFLETGNERWYRRLEKELPTDNASFVAFVSPYFSQRFNHLLNTALQAGDFAKATELMQHHDWLQPGDRFEAFQDARYFFWWRAKELEEKGRGEGISEPEKDRYVHPGLLDSLSAISAFFPSLTDYYAASLGEAIVATVNQQRNMDLGVELMLAAVSLPVNSDLANALGQLKNQLRHMIEKSQPLRRLMVELLPFPSLRKGRWRLWEVKTKDSLASWAARLSILVAVVLVAFWFRHTAQSYPVSPKPAAWKSVSPTYMEERDRLLLEFENAIQALSEQPHAIASVNSHPPIHPYQSILNPKPVVGITFPVKVNNPGPSDLHLIMVPVHPVLRPMQDILVPAGQEKEWNLPMGVSMRVLVVLGNDWTDSPLTISSGLTLPGHFTCIIQPTQWLGGTEGEQELWVNEHLEIGLEMELSETE